MASRRIINFFTKNTRNKVNKFIINDYENTQYTQLHPRLPFLIRRHKYKIKYAPDNNPGGQLKNLAYSMTDLIRDERIELNYNRATEVRGYAERLIHEAMRHGDLHRPTMGLANFWLNEKQLIHKLFKVLVPRYINYTGPMTAIHNLGKPYELSAEPRKARGAFTHGRAVLELRGNPLPPVNGSPRINTSNFLTNVLLNAAEKEAKKNAGVKS